MVYLPYMEVKIHGQAPQNDISALIIFFCYFQIHWRRKLTKIHSIYCTLKRTMPALEQKISQSNEQNTRKIFVGMHRAQHKISCDNGTLSCPKCPIFST